MPTHLFNHSRFAEYESIESYSSENGCIAWRKGTGDNVELLYLKVSIPRKGTGTHLLRYMLRRLRTNPPYHSVFGFTRTSNVEAQMFYEAMGFALTHVSGVYQDGSAILFSQSYSSLLIKHGLQ